MNLNGLLLWACGGPGSDKLDSYFGLPSSTTWNGLLTLTFINEASTVDFDAGWGGPATGQLVFTATPEPASIIFLGTVVAGVGFAIKRRFSATV
jgi:hypothetical protein